MEFPVYVPLGPFRLHPHLLFESLAYVVGFRLFLAARHRAGDPLPSPTRWSLVAAAIVGAVVGSKVVAWVNEPYSTWDHRHDLLFLLGGKSIVGGLLGGLIAVEATKRRLGVRVATGDLYAVPLAVGIAIGRIGCFLTGLDDHTHGRATGGAWGVDLGDGVLRHPTQLYEILFLLGLTAALLSLGDRDHRPGDRFKLFMVAYLAWRFVLGFLQPAETIGPLSGIQWVCLAGLAYYARLVRHWFIRAPEATHA